jgi:monovalent cation:H+ antiporter-2, CPA2 family
MRPFGGKIISLQEQDHGLGFQIRNGQGGRFELYTASSMLFVTQNFLEDMALVMCVAALAAVLCQVLRQPLVVGYLVAGMVLGPHVPGVYANPDRVKLVSEVGVTLLVFSIGLEFNFRRLVRLTPTAGLIALVQAASMIGLGYLTGRLMGWTPWESFVTGTIISISGAVIVVKVLEDVPVDSRVRELVLGVVLCEDVIGILVLAVLITLGNGGALSFHALEIDTRHLSSFIIVVILIGLITVPYLVRGVARFKRPEMLLITSLGLCFALAVIAERLGYTVVLGAFLAGSLVAESERGTEVGTLVEPVRHIFGAIFFVSVGMLIDPQLLASHWAALAMLTVTAVVGKTISVSLASVIVGEPPNVAVKTGFAMAQIGTFSVLFAIAGTGGTGSLLYSLAVALKAITAALCPLMIRASHPAGNWIDRHLPIPVQSVLSEYDAWLDQIRQPHQPEKRERGAAD